MLNEFVYCPRLAYLEWVQKEWAESADTVEGSHVHRRADRASGELPSPEEVIDGAVRQVSALSLSSDSIGVTAKLDVLETSDGGVVPVDYKRGKRPHTARKAWDPERVQLCAQGMLLEDAGYRCTSGVLYFVASRERVRVDFDDELRAMTRISCTTVFFRGESLGLIEATVYPYDKFGLAAVFPRRKPRPH